MLSLKLINIFLLFLLLQFSINDRKLIFVYEHARHGARGPSSSYGAILNNGVDEYGVDWGTDGELTQIGKRQHYFLGVRNKLKYGGLIDFKKYNPKQILIHATDYNRTHQSILSELYGMYEDMKEAELVGDEAEYDMVNEEYMQKSNYTLYDQIKQEFVNLGNKVNKLSFPVFNIHKFPDKRIFLVDDCIKMKNYRDEKVGNVVKQYIKDFDDEFADAFFKFTGKTADYFHLYDIMKSITDHFICNYDNKRDLSNLEVHGLNLTRFYNFSKSFYGHFIFNYFIDEYTSGLEETHLMQDLLGYMDKRIEYGDKESYRAPKMVMDCGHDTTVGPIARFLGASFNKPYHEFCEFACNIFIELYSEGGGKYSVDYYLDDELIFGGLDYDVFKSTLQAHFWNDSYVDEFCGRKEDTDITDKSSLSDYANILFMISIITTILFLIFVSSTVIIFRRLKKLEKKLKENPLMNEELEGNELPELT